MTTRTTTDGGRGPHMARPLRLTVWGRALLLLIGGTLPVVAPLPAWALTFTHTQLTTSTGGNNFDSSINANGTKIAFYSTSNLTGGNPDGNMEIFLWTAGAGLTQITTSTGGRNESPSINADGTKIAFSSTHDLTGGNADGNQEIFLWIAGAGFTQITSTTGGGNYSPSINSDGTKIAFQSDRNLTGGNLDGNTEIFLWTQGSGFTQLTTTTGGYNTSASINADGTKIVFYSTNNLTGGNADGNYEIFLWTQGSGITQLTASTGGDNREPSINADGTKIAFESDRDLTGGNPDGNWEIFLWTQGSGITQLTASTGGDNREPSINADGRKIAFYSTNNLTGGNPDGNYEIFLWTQGSGFTQLTTTTGSGSDNFSPSINSDGTKIAFESSSDLTGGNTDHNYEIFLATLNPHPDIKANSADGPLTLSVGTLLSVTVALDPG
ncbi:hypothetical protein EPN27_03925, partial [Patescibacteria group bacterium]